MVVVQVPDALPGVEVLYLPLTVRVAKKQVPKRAQVLDAFAANLAPVVSEGATAQSVLTRLHQ